MIALLDYGAGNLRNVEKALRKLDADVDVMTTPDRLSDADACVLPGVGAFDDCINSLRQQELLEASREFITTGKPFLGICVGYQALFERSEEFNSSAKGLSVFDGNVIRFPDHEGLKVPQIGWNQVELKKNDCPIFKGIEDNSYFYFVHSFHPEPTDDSIVVGRTDYGRNFASAVWRDNVYATQFHPEKSQTVGIRLLENFVNLSK
jgi:imidazole glycerol-phosphate synthase subunit HisH